MGWMQLIPGILSMLGNRNKGGLQPINLSPIATQVAPLAQNQGGALQRGFGGLLNSYLNRPNNNNNSSSSNNLPSVMNMGGGGFA